MTGSRFLLVIHSQRCFLCLFLQMTHVLVFEIVEVLVSVVVVAVITVVVLTTEGLVIVMISVSAGTKHVLSVLD